MRSPVLDLLRSAYGKYAVGAFNVSNMEQFRRINAFEFVKGRACIFTFIQL